MVKKVGLRRALGILAFALAVVSGILNLASCTGGGNPATDTGGTVTGPGKGGGTCATPNPGCACPAQGLSQACGSTVSEDDGGALCSSGTMICGGGGTWGPCIGNNFHSVPRTHDVHPLTISNDAGACANNPCDPYCQTFTDTANGLDAGVDSGLVLGDAGLTLAVSPQPPPIPCTGLAISPPDASVVITTLDAAAYDGSAIGDYQFNAYYTPSNCASGTASALWAISPGASVATVNTTGNVSVVNPIAGSLGVNAYAGSCIGDGGCPKANLNVTVNVLDTSNAPSGVTAGQMTGAGSGTDDLTIVYPYNYTVLPLGLLPPTIQWAAPNSVSSITVTASGAGYTSPTSVSITGGGGSGAQASATLNSTGALALGTYAATSAGAGYTSAPSASFNNGGSGVAYTTTLASTGSLATGSHSVSTAGAGYTSTPTATFSNGGSGVTYTTTLATTGSLALGTHTVTTGGAGYTSTPTMAFSNGGTGVAYTVTMAPGSLTTGTYTVTTQGAGYTSNPTITFGGGGSGVVYNVTRSGAKVTTFTITNGGSGFTSPASVTFSGGGGTTQATYTPTIPLIQTVASFAITNGGSNFTAASTATFSGGGGTTQATYTTAIPLTYGLASFNVTGGGSGFTGPSNVTFAGGGATTQATYTPTLSLTYGLASLTITNGGSGFTGPSTVTFSGGGATTQATDTNAIPLTYGIASVSVTSAGSGYASPPTITITGGSGTGATASATLGAGPTATAVKVSLLYPANGSQFTYSEIVPEMTSTYDGLSLAAAVAGASFPTQAWSAFAQSAAGQNAFISVQRLVGSTLYPPQTVNVAFATNQLKGTVYYNTYGTKYAYNYWNTREGGYFGAATLAIQPGATTPTPIEGYTNTSSAGQGCRVCHVVSANGNRLITELGTNYNQSETLSLPTTTWLTSAPNTGEQGMNATFTWSALFPDASLLFSNGAGLPGGSTSTSGLYKMTTPASPTAVTVTGLPTINAGTPAFSVDGKHVAFNYNGGSGVKPLTGSGTVSSDSKSLAVIDFNGTTTFSNARIVATPGSNGLTLPSGGSDATGQAWYPSFIPDANDDVVFHYETYSDGRDTAGTRSQCDSNGPTSCQNEGSHAEMWWVPTATSNATSYRLNCANGLSDTNCPITTTGTSYLPPHASYSPQTSYVGGATNPTYGADWNLNYEPTILPEQIGGYYWMVFTSRRLYGNVATINPYWSDPRFEYIANAPTTKKLWVAAINPNPTAGHDPSYPAFYLDGQELLAGNSRGYWALNACEAAGTTSTSLCTSDLDCCSGESCVLDTPLPSPPTSHCSSNAVTCVADGAACTSASLCCDASAVCNQGICQVPPPLPYYLEADFSRTYSSPCGAGTRPIWHAWEYETTTPSDSQIIFVVQTSNTLSSLTANVDAGSGAFDGAPVQLPTIISGASITTLGPGQDVQSALLAAGQQSATYLRVIARLIPSTDGRSAPSLSAWDQTFDCIAAQ